MAVLGKTRSWEAFSAWCDERGLTAAPANPWTLAAYIRVLEGTMRFDALKRHIDQVGQMHFEKRRTRPDREPSVQRVLDAVRRREEAKKRAQKQAKEKPPAPPLFRAEDFLEDGKAKTSKGKTTRTRRGKAAKPEAGKKKSKSLRATPKLVRRKRV
ncbi:MAG: hypothetical protein JJ900_17145 [Rhodospirillales bacterium]|nr:hypothetical protein [Rhodospirillales bacterium]MBO6788577.1 hypothetical protein [Rhodospirillales bacterium]